MTDEPDTERLDRLLAAAAALPRSIAPERDAWPAIRDRIEAQRVRAIASPTGAPAGSSGRRIAWFAAAAVVLVTATSAVTVLVVRGHSAPPLASVPPSQQAAPVESARTRVAPVAPFTTQVGAASSAPSLNPVFARYDAAARDLVADLDLRRARLDPRTAAVLDSCLRRIDAAIAEARGALRQDPKNAVVTELLTASYTQKLDLLKRAADLPLASFQD